MSEKKDKSKITAIYARVSTAQQSTGLDAQVRALRTYCQQNNITDYIIYEDEAISGAKDSRPALNRMMKDVEEGKIERVCVYSFSRYARSTTHLLKALEIFKKRAVSFVSLTEKIDTDTPLGIAVFTIIGAISQLERDLIRERVINGLKAAKARGVRIGRKKMRPSQLIRRLRLSGLTYREISKISKVSQGAVAAELKQWEKEKKEGTEMSLEGDLPPEEQALAEEASKPKVEPVEEEAPQPVPVVKF